MAKRGPDEAFLLVDGYDVGSETLEFSINKRALTEEDTGLGDTDETHAVVGVDGGDLTQRAFYDDTANKTEDELIPAARLGALRVVAALESGNTARRDMSLLSARQANVATLPGRGELTKVEAAFLPSGPIDEGKIIQALAAQTGAGASSDGSLDNAGSSSNGGIGILQVTALTLGGYTSIDIKIQDSANDSTWADLVAFTATATAPSAEISAAVTGTVDRYLRAFITLTGSGSSQSITMLVAFARR